MNFLDSLEEATRPDVDKKPWMDEVTMEQSLVDYVIALAAATRDHDDIQVFSDEGRQDELMRLCHLRQQRSMPQDKSHHCPKRTPQKMAHAKFAYM